ncbi:MAG: 50S ribosomal protein L10 [Gammaproteobacteria bacterium]|nr:50S ribosomal protein L10 [Gammaproteobacteria bacterium]MBL6818924.1 50S ribosomal protein L10 [Gammaproteobacteria bacterium]MBL6898698.1 50S ribosomal protein L10 [Gammaproteobacteria bacterium]
MPLNLTQKQDLVKEMSAVLNDAEVVLTADYSGLTANELNELRKSTREAGVFVKLVKNNMLKMALKESQFSSMSENIFGPQIVAVGKEDAGKFAKSIKEFIDKHENLKPKAINYQGQDLDISELQKLASLPTYEEAISKLLSVMQGPIKKLMGTMQAVPGKLVRTIDAVKALKN